MISPHSTNGSWTLMARWATMIAKGGSFMDQAKIGKFIAECRKKQGLTQMQLAEKMNVTDRAVSKWETGKAMPDSSIMLALCDALKINVTDLLNGERITMENFNKETQNKLIEMIKQKEESDRRLLGLEWVIAIFSLIVLFTPILIAILLPMKEWQQTLLCFCGIIPAIVGFLFAIKIEQVAGYYECKKCKHTYVPKYASVSFAMHLGRTRYMRCPNCKKRSWAKKVISK